ncbi:MAG: sialate O-acetylesterase [Thiotrichaceae bacterium]|nr:sialate O-acetylesterase [Thiotrichaceae bacterium]
MSGRNQYGAVVATFVILGILLFGSVAQARDYVYILAGQSNMMGKGSTHSLPSYYKKTPHNVQFFYQGRYRKLAKYAHFGPEISFAHTVARSRPHDKHYIIKFVATGSSISQWQPGGALFKGLLSQKKLAGIAPETPITAVVWMQGESDARSRSSAVQYQGRLARFIRGLRTKLNTPHTKVVIGLINPTPKAFPMTDKVREAQRKISTSIPNVRLVSTDNLSKIYDHIHYGTDGVVGLGKRFAKAIFH